MAKNGKIKWKTGVCDVHRYALGDTTKRKTFYCPICNVNLCRTCANNPLLRTVAMINRDIEKLGKEFKNDVTFNELLK